VLRLVGVEWQLDELVEPTSVLLRTVGSCIGTVFCPLQDQRGKVPRRVLAQVEPQSFRWELPQPAPDVRTRTLVLASTGVAVRLALRTGGLSGDDSSEKMGTLRKGFDHTPAVAH